MSNFSLYRAGQSYEDAALNFPIDVVRLEPAKRVPADVRVDALAPQPVAPLP